MLELKNISFSVEDEANKKQKEILNNINLTVDEDSFVVITGPNGGGKSTLAKIIMGPAQLDAQCSSTGAFCLGAVGT